MGYRAESSMRPYRHAPRPIGVHPVQLPELHLKTTAFLCLNEVPSVSHAVSAVLIYLDQS
jgi:hypothetical protein